MGHKENLSPAALAACEAAWPGIIERVTAGETYTAVVESQDLVTVKDLWRYSSRFPERYEELEQARRKGVEHDLDTIKQLHLLEKDPAMMRARLDALKWYIAKRNPDKYSDRLDARVRVETVDMTAIIAQARLRAERARLPQPAQLISITKLDDLM